MKMTFKEDYKHKGWHNFEENLTQPRHCWYPFKEGFSNQLVAEAIKQSTAGKKKAMCVLDPFSGSGTTPLTASLLGYDSISLEVNPFCVFTSKIKCLPGAWNIRMVSDTAMRIVSAASKEEVVSPLEGSSTFTEGEEKEKFLFNRSVLRGFQSTWDAIEESGNGHSGPLKLAAIRAAMNCCNAKKDGKCLRYLENWKELNYSADNFYRNFSSIVTRMLRDVELAPINKNRKAKLIKGDAREKLATVESRSCNLLVTSPPYLNSFDYSDVYRPELFLGGFVKSNEELRKIRLKTVRSHVQVDWGGETAVDNPMVKSIVNALGQKEGLWNKKIPTMVEAYFHDMQKVLREAARALRKGAEAWIVVSTSAYEGIQIPVDLILADLANDEGFALDGIYALRTLRAAGQQQASFGTKGHPLRESLIILKR